MQVPIMALNLLSVDKYVDNFINKDRMLPVKLNLSTVFSVIFFVTHYI